MTQERLLFLLSLLAVLLAGMFWLCYLLARVAIEFIRLLRRQKP